MKLREEFVVRALEPGSNISELCREYSISRKTAYKWLKRFEQRGSEGLADLSRRPDSNPLRASGEAVLKVLELRRERPRWGPKKLHAVLVRRGLKDVPSVRTIARIIDRAGETRKRRRRGANNVSPIDRPSVTAAQPNDVWTVDFKGWWRAADGTRCEPLTVRDAYSRFILFAQVLPSTRWHDVRDVCERLFEQHGLPRAIQMDNGPPFSQSAARCGLTRLSAWWVSLGIQLVRSRPACPQDNGGHERMHLDMRYEVEDQAADTLELQRHVLDNWRHEFNQVRPHEALDLRVPADVYRSSPRRYRGSNPVLYPSHWQKRIVDCSGHITYRGNQLFVGRGLRGYAIAIDEISAQELRLWFYDLDLGELRLTEAA